MKIDLKNILFYCGLPIVLGITVTLLIGDKVNYFDVIKLPVNTPKWLFMVMWTIIYILTGISTYRIDSKGYSNKIFYISLVLNLLWLPIFFVIRNNAFSFIYTLGFLIYIAYNTYKYYKLDNIAGYLMLPYFLWMIFGTYLTLGILILN